MWVRNPALEIDDCRIPTAETDEAFQMDQDEFRAMQLIAVVSFGTVFLALAGFLYSEFVPWFARLLAPFGPGAADGSAGLPLTWIVIIACSLVFLSIAAWLIFSLGSSLKELRKKGI